MAKYDSERKLSRNIALQELHTRRPEMSYRELGELFGISRQRVWVIVKGNHKALLDLLKGKG